MNTVTPEGGFRTHLEKDVGKRIEKVFSDCPDTIEIKLDNFTKYIRRQRLTRLLYYMYHPEDAWYYSEPKEYTSLNTI